MFALCWFFIVSETGHWVGGTGHWVAETGHWVGRTGHWVAETRHSLGGTGHWVGGKGTLGCGIESFASHSKNYDETSKNFHVCEEAM